MKNPFAPAKTWPHRTTVTMLIGVTALLAGCTAMRVAGKVVNSETGQPAGNCYVTLASETVLTDFAGQYKTKVRRRKVKEMEVVCADYEPQAIAIDKSKSRRQVVDVEMVPARRQRARNSQEAAPRAEAPVKADTNAIRADASPLPVSAGR
jgi:hypothetical protein